MRAHHWLGVVGGFWLVAALGAGCATSSGGGRSATEAPGTSVPGMPGIDDPSNPSNPSDMGDPSNNAGGHARPYSDLGRRWVAEAEAPANDDLGRFAAYQKVVQVAPDSAQAQYARLALAEEAVARGAFDDVVMWLPADEAPEAEFAYRWHRVQALALEGRGAFKAASAVWFTAASSASTAPPTNDAGPIGGTAQPKGSERREAGEGRARSLFLSGDSHAAEDAFGHASGAKGEARVEGLKRLIEPAVTPSILEHLYGAMGSPDPWSAWVGLKWARARCEAADLAGCREAAERAKAHGDAGVRADADEILAMVASWDSVKPQALGVLLPLSGPYRKLGQAALEGIQTALAGRKGVTLVVRDTKGEADEAARQAESLILDGNIAALLGPIGRHESRATVAVTRRFGLPHMVLSGDHEAATDAPAVLRYRLSRVEQAVAIARHAVTQLDVQNAAILYPDHSAGQAFMMAFWDEIERLGGEVRAAQGYDPETRDFNSAIKTLIGARKPGTGKVDFDALFLPDDALTVRRLVPFLKYWGMDLRTAPRTGKRRGVQLLGASGWNHAAVIDRGENGTDNAIFVDGFFHDPDDPDADRFTRAFFKRYKRRPSTFQAEVRDAMVFLMNSMIGLGGEAEATHSHRVELLAALRAPRTVRGATGVMRVVDGGAKGSLLVRAPAVLTIDLDTIRPRLSEAEERATRARRFKEPMTGPPQ